ncbi:MAG: dTMP kinase [Spirochaetaceae bacterium]|nr:dTMP kinase [Spirochaetaceae bacterium]
MAGSIATLKRFTVIEGCDGSGTSTQLELLRNRFSVPAKSKKNAFLAAEPEPVYGFPPFFYTCEPTQGPVGLLIRRILKGECTVTKETLARLFAADRWEHLYGPAGIAEHCKRGELVVSDRYTPSSLVYQGLECGPELPETLNAGFPLPELLIYLDVDPQTAMKRIAGRKEKQEIYEKAGFQARVREAYLKLLPAYEQAGVRVVSLDGTRPPEEIAPEIWSAVLEMPIMKEAGNQK